MLGPPSEPAGVKADSTMTTSLRINWFPGRTNGLPVDYYTIQSRVEGEEGVMTNWEYINNDDGGSKFIKPCSFIFSYLRYHMIM